MAKKIMELPYTEDNVNLFISRFTTGRWAYQGDFNPEKGITPYVPGGNEHLTSTLVKRHLNAEMTLGSYVITPQNTCRFLVIDFDIDTVAAKAMLTNPGSKKAKKDHEEALKRMQGFVSEIMKRMEEELKISRNQMLLEKSGSKGYHIWLFFADPVSAQDTYKLTRVLANELDLQSLEIYPRQPSSDDQRPGSLIKLPLGINRKTMERCTFLDENFENLLDQWKALDEVITITETQLNNLIKLRDTEVDSVEDGSVDDLTKYNGSMETMINTCSVLADFKSRVESADTESDVFNFTHDERLCQLSLFKWFGMGGRAKIHEFNSKTHNYDYDKCERIIEESALKPMTCDTMRQRGMCKKECEAIVACQGKSPIKLAMLNARRSKGDVVILNSLAEIENPILCGKTVRVDFMVSAVIDTPYHSVKKVTYQRCTAGTCEKFEDCELEGKGNPKTVTVDQNSKDHIAVYGEEDSKVLNTLKKKVEGCIAPKYLLMQGEPEKYLVQPFACSNLVKMMGEEMIYSDRGTLEMTAAKEAKDYVVFYLGNILESSKAYRGYGVVMTNPQNQNLTLLFSHVEPVHGQVDDFEINSSNKDNFEAFRTLTLAEIVKDFRDNITYIYGRDELILSVLLTHFSALKFSFNQAPISRGWVETVIIGDTGQAKSTLTERIINYIGLGRIEYSNTTVAGLVGGVLRLQNKNFIQWGALPKNHKGLLFLDEIQNLGEDLWKQLRTCRSAGIAKITKIVAQEHPSCVRLICAANPMPKDRELADFKYGAHSLASIMSPADIRRFDIACFVSSGDLDKKFVNIKNSTNKPRITREMVRTASMWAWSRRPEDIEFSDELTDLILKEASNLSTKYGGSTDVPICNTSDTREKLARLVVASAALHLRTPDYIKLVPTKEDLALVINLLTQMYSHPSVALDIDSREKSKVRNLDDEQFEEIKEILSEKGMEKAVEVMGLMTGNVPIKPQDACGSLGIRPEDMSKIIISLSRLSIIKLSGVGGAYVAMPKLTKLLAKLRSEESMII